MAKASVAEEVFKFKIEKKTKINQLPLQEEPVDPAPKFIIQYFLVKLNLTSLETALVFAPTNTDQVEDVQFLPLSLCLSSPN